MKSRSILLVILFSVINYTSIYSQMEHRYIGLHYEYGATLNMRYGRIDCSKSHFFFEAALPRLVTSLAGWKVSEQANPVRHGRYMSLRGGKHFKMGEQSSLGFDLLWEFTGVAAPPDTDETKNFTGYLTMPLAAGIAYTQSIGENFSFVLIPAYGYACTKTRNNDGKQFKRISCDIYLQMKASEILTLYGGAGYVYYPKGLPLSYPQDASFGGPLFSIGIAAKTSW